MLGARVASGGARAVAGAAAEGNPGAQRMIDALPSTARPPSGPGSGGMAARMVFGRSGFTDEKGNGNGDAASGSGSQSGAGPQEKAGTSDSQPVEQANTAHPAASDAAGRAEAVRRSEQAFSVPGINRPAFDRAGVNEAWQTMQASSQMSPPDTAGVVAAMAQFSPETQQGLAAFHAGNPTRMRQFSAQHVGAAGLSDAQRDALLTLGSAPHGTLEKGISSAMGGLDSQSGNSDHTAPSSVPATQAARGSAAPGPTTQPQASHSPGGSRAVPSGERPPAEARSLGADLPEQPAGPVNTPGHAAARPSSDRPDPEPFLD
jgi:hypothetical protein